jgi:hypothetical protein
MPSFDEVKLEDVLHGSFATFNPNTGANKDGDSTPTIFVYKEGSSTALTITSSVTNITTGRYRWQINIAAADGFEQGKFYEVWASATVTGTDTVTQSTPVMSFKATSSVVDDVKTAIAAEAVKTSAIAVIANKIGSVVFGTVTGAGTSTEVFVGAGITTTVTVDVDGNRSAVVFS